jgi:uncharacterized protein with NAD-binding domain and iron-sulfur cluster
VAGGKCRSIPSPGTGSGSRADLPGEHGFRFFPGYYRHVIDTMSRIPCGSNRNGVKDNLVFGEQARFSRRDALDIPFPYRKLNSVNPFTDLTQALIGLIGVIPGLGLNEIAYFATRLTEFVTSSDARRDNQYDKISWFDFVRAERFGPIYQNLLTRSLTRNLVAAEAELASTRTIGLQATRILVSNIIFSMYDEASRLLNGPTTEAWIDPWLTYLRNRGVRWFPTPRWRASTFKTAPSRAPGFAPAGRRAPSPPTSSCWPSRSRPPGRCSARRSARWTRRSPRWTT